MPVAGAPVVAVAGLEAVAEDPVEESEKSDNAKTSEEHLKLHSEEYASPTNYKQKLSIVEIRKQLTKVLESEEKLKPSDQMSQRMSTQSF